jgi:hypothetical protein
MARRRNAPTVWTSLARLIDATASVVSAFARLIDAAARRVQPRALPTTPTPAVRLVYDAADTAGASKRSAPPAAATPAGVDDAPVVGALRNLGFKPAEVNAVLPRLQSTDAAARVGEALRLLGRRAG